MTAKAKVRQENKMLKRMGLPQLEEGDRILVRCPRRCKCSYLTAGKEYVANIFSIGSSNVHLKLLDNVPEFIWDSYKESGHLKGLNWQYVRKVK